MAGREGESNGGLSRAHACHKCQVADYGKLGHAEAVGMRIPKASVRDFAREYFQLFDKKGDRPDKGDRGPEYRSIVGLPGGMNGELFAAVKCEAEGLVELKEGVGNDPDTIGKRTVSACPHPPLPTALSHPLPIPPFRAPFLAPFLAPSLALLLAPSLLRCCQVHTWLSFVVSGLLPRLLTRFLAHLLSCPWLLYLGVPNVLRPPSPLCTSHYLSCSPLFFVILPPPCLPISPNIPSMPPSLSLLLVRSFYL